MATEKDKQENAHPRRPWRDNIEAITMAIIMAVLLKYFIIEAYKIPTGSMQPTLMGNDETGIHDRILVDKLSFHLRDPERFEVVVFKYPLDRSKNFIKRIIGMPSEWLMVLNGDLWTRPDSQTQYKILRRPKPVLESVLKTLIKKGQLPWKLIAGDDWTLAAHEIQARGDGQVRFPRSGVVMDNYTDGYPGGMGAKLVRGRGHSMQKPVGDLRIEGVVEALPGCRAVIIKLTEGRRSYEFNLPGPAAAQDARVQLLTPPTNGNADSSFASAEPYRLPAGRRVRFSVQNIDDLLTLELGGETILEQEIPAATDQSAVVFLGLEGEGADFDELSVLRDIYYTSDRAKVHEWEIPEGHYVMLGDNTQDSSDSREWTFKVFQVDQEELDRIYGPGSDIEVMRANYHMNHNPRVVTGGSGGPILWLRDEWGELHHMPQSSTLALSPQQASLVPRHLITGRAVLVFWPFVPSLDVYRLRWIH